MIIRKQAEKATQRKIFSSERESHRDAILSRQFMPVLQFLCVRRLVVSSGVLTFAACFRVDTLEDITFQNFKI